MEWNYFYWFLGMGMLSVVMVQTSFVPDEYWQVLEPAHYLVFGYGKLTWEWDNGIRGWVYPFIFAIIYKILAILHLDYVTALIYAPRILQATMSAVGLCYTCELANKVYGKEAKFWTAAALSTNWFIFYCMSRTLYNTIESVFLVLAMKFCGWLYGADGNHRRFVLFAAIGCTIYPSAAIILFPISLAQWIIMRVLPQVRVRAIRQRYEKRHICAFLISLTFQIVIDSFCYGTFCISIWESFKNFMKFDLNNGTSPCYWYIVSGLPTVLCTHLGVLVVAVLRRTRIHKALMILCTLTVLQYSCFERKEIRHLLPVVHLLCIIVGIHLQKMENYHKRCKKRNWNPNLILLVLFITNFPMAFSFGYSHNRGTLDAMQFLAEDKTPDNLMNVTFLMPCQSTPGYSHLHRNISMQFLSCEPNLHYVKGYMNEADTFYNDPYKWISGRDLSGSTHIVIFDSLKDTIWYFLQSFKLCAKIFHTASPSGPRIGEYVEIYCK